MTIDEALPQSTSLACRPIPQNSSNHAGAAQRLNLKWAKMTRVLDHLYIGGAIALNSRLVYENNITFIINATVEAPTLFLNGVETMKLWVKDTPETDLSAHFDTVADMIHYVGQNGGRALVHCLAGVSRSAALVLAYLVKYKRMSLREAYRFLASTRSVVRPSLTFWHQLISFEQQVRGVSRGSVSFMDVPGSDSQLPDVYMVTVEEEEEPDEEAESTPDLEEIVRKFSFTKPAKKPSLDQPAVTDPLSIKVDDPAEPRIRASDSLDDEETIMAQGLEDERRQKDDVSPENDSGMDTEIDENPSTLDGPGTSPDPWNRIPMPVTAARRKKHASSSTTSYASSTSLNSEL